jgi:hypothetical protein
MHLDAKESADTSLGHQLNTGMCIGSAMLILPKRCGAPLASSILGHSTDAWPREEIEDLAVDLEPPL